MIALFTDFGSTGPYVGQVKVALHREAPGVAVVDLLADAPAYDPRASGYLLAALVGELPVPSVVLGVVDPGVGSASREPVVLRADGRWLVGPGNGIFDVTAAAARATPRWWRITYRPERLSSTFHARDLFAPVAARLARGDPPSANWLEPLAVARPRVPADLWEIVYVDGYGNAVTAVRGQSVPAAARLRVGGVSLRGARTFSDVPPGEGLWYVNSIGLVEVAVNRGDAARTFGLAVGDAVRVD